MLLRTLHVKCECLSVHMIQLENHLGRYGCCASDGYLKLSTFYFATISNMNMTDNRTCEVRLTLVALTVGSYNDVQQHFFEKYRTLIKLFFVWCKTTGWWLHETIEFVLTWHQILDHLHVGHLLSCKANLHVVDLQCIKTLFV